MSFETLSFTADQAKTFARNLRRAMAAAGLDDPGHGRALDLVAVAAGFAKGWNEMAAAAVRAAPPSQDATFRPWSHAEVRKQVAEGVVEENSFVLQAEYIATFTDNVYLPQGYKVTDLKGYRVAGEVCHLEMTDGTIHAVRFDFDERTLDGDAPRTSLFFLSDGFGSIDESLVLGRDGALDWAPEAEAEEPSLEA